MAAVEKKFEVRFWAKADMIPYNVRIQPSFIPLIMDAFFEWQKQGLTYSQKSVINFDQSKLFAMPEYAQYKDDWMGMDWRAATLHGFIPNFYGVKDLYSFPLAKTSGGKRQSSVITVRHFPTGGVYGMVDGTDISDLRTTIYTLWTLKRYFSKSDPAKVLFFGASDLPEITTHAIAQLCPELVESITFRSTGASAGKLVEKLRRDLSNVPFDLQASSDADVLFNADLVIGLTTSFEPLWTKGDVGPNAITMVLGHHEATFDYIGDVLERAEEIFCDDKVVVEERKAQSLGMYFDARGEKLTEQAAKYNILNMCDAPQRLGERNKGPVHISAAGMAALDVAFAAKALQLLEAAMNQKFLPLTAEVSSPQPLPTSIEYRELDGEENGIVATEEGRRFLRLN